MGEEIAPVTVCPRAGLHRATRAPDPGSGLRPDRIAAVVVAVLVAFPTALPATGPGSSDPGEASPSGTVHTELTTSEPADGATVTSPPERIRLTFSGPVQPRASRIRVTGGEDGVDLALEPGSPADRGDVLVAPIPSPLGEGAYRVGWRTLSRDGHPVSGEYAFRVALPDTVKAAPEGGRAHTPSRGEAGAARTASEGSDAPVLVSIFRGASSFALLAAAGLLAFLAWLAPAPPPRGGELARALASAAPFLLVAHLGTWASYAAGAPIFDGATWAAVTGTFPGRVEGTRALLAAGAMVAFVAGGSAPAGAILSGAAVLAGGALGHPGSTASAVAIPANAVHLAGAALWLGGLLVLVTGVDDRDGLRANARRVSAVALASVVAVAGTGFLQALLFLSTPSDLVRTGYGLALAGKGAGLAVLVGFGYRHRFRLIPTLEADGTDAGESLRRSVGWEAMVVLAVVVLAGFLAYLPAPA